MLKLSVFISCRNHARFLKFAAESCLTQTQPPDELILINDSSTDSSLEVMQNIKKDYEKQNVIIVNHEKRIGHIAAYNEGISLCKNELIHLMAADDRLCYPEFYSIASHLLENPNIGFVTGKLTGIDSTGNIIGGSVVGPPLHERQPSYKWLEALYRYGNFICGGAVIVRKKLQEEAGPYEDRLPFSADFMNWIKILARCNSAFSIPKVVYQYRKHYGQMTSHSSAPQEERAICREALGAVINQLQGEKDDKELDSGSS